jgi:hypothetical protein
VKRVRELTAGAIGVIVPSRERVEDLRGVYASMIETSTEAVMLLYIDNDQEAAYAEFKDLPRCHMLVGNRVGPVSSANTLCDRFRGSVRIYGMVPDDAQFLTRGWDRYLTETFEAMPGRVGVISAAHNGGSYVNFPWVSREWVETVGWYFYPHNFHHCCDTILEVLGEATRIEYARPDQFEMHHDLKHTMNRDQFDGDLMGCLNWLVGERRELVRRIRAAIERGSHEPAPA